MTTYAISGQMFLFDYTGANPVINSVVPVTLSIVMADANTVFSYDTFGSGVGFFDAVTIDLMGAYDIRIEGAGVLVEREEFVQDIEAQIGTVENPDGMTTSDVLNLYNFDDPDAAFRDFYFDLGGQTPLPILTSGAAALTYLEDTQVIGGITSGPFLEDTPISYTAFPTVTVIENDIINGGDLADVIDAGLGNDQVFGLEGDDTLNGGVGNDLLDGGDDDDTLSGGNGNDLLRGEDGDDTLEGGRGNDTERGGAGNDTFIAFTGDDLIVGGAGIDTVDYSKLGSALAVDLRITVAQTISAAAGNDRIVQVENVIGGKGGDTIYGTNGVNTLDGFNGNDTVFGLGDDDMILGGTFNDTLRGNAGDDTLIGGAGRDFLGGGAGADTFVFESASDSVNGGFRDRVQDFTQGEDLIDLSAIDTGAASDAFVFVGAGGFAGAGEIRFIQIAPANKTIIYGNTDADGASEFQIEVTGLVTLTADDFIL